MARRSECDECRRLWREYAAATTAHVRLQAELRAAAPDQLEALPAQVQAAEKKRTALREAIRRHEELAHGGPED